MLTLVGMQGHTNMVNPANNETVRDRHFLPLLAGSV